MTKKGREIVLSLLLEGKLTKDEAIEMLDNEEELEDIKEPIDVVKQEAKNKIDYIADLTNDLYNDMKVEDILDYMHKTKWKWQGKYVTNAMFKDCINYLLTGCVENIVSKNKEEYSISTGGLRVNCYIEEGQFIAECSFEMSNGYANMSYNKLKNSK